MARIDDLIPKPSRELKIGERIRVRKTGFSYTYKVLDFPKSRVGAKLVSDYVADVTPVEDAEKNELLLLANKLNRDKGLGRPTKRERRDLDSFFGDDDY